MTYITILSECMNELIHFFIAFSCLITFKRNIENIKYCIKRHVAPIEHCVSCELFNKFFKLIHYIFLNNFIRMIDAVGSANRLCLFDFSVSSFSTFNHSYIKIYDPRLPQPPKVFTILLVKMLSLKQKLNQILLVS